MDTSKLQNLSRRERQIMDLLFQHKEMTAQQVTDQLAEAPSYTTVRTLLRILEDKGHLKHSKTGRKYVYQPVDAPDSIRQHSFQHLLKTFFGGSITEAVATFINSPDTQVSAEELKELEDIVKKAKVK